MNITRTADYAVRAVIHVAAKGDGRRAPAAEIAREQSIPPIYVSKVLQALCRAGLLDSTPGRTGGTSLARQAEDISLLEVIEAVDGPVSLNRCVESPDSCPRSGTCVVHEFWKDTYALFAERLRAARIADFVALAQQRAGQGAQAGPRSTDGQEAAAQSPSGE